MGTLEHLSNVELAFVTVAVSATYVVALSCRSIRSFARLKVTELAMTLPTLGEIASLIGLVFAAMAVLIGFSGPDEAARFEIAFLFLSSTIVALFLVLLFRSWILWWTVYLAGAALATAWYCLAWSVFALVDIFLPDKDWRFMLLVGPSAMVLYALGSLAMMQAQKSEEIAPATPPRPA